MTAPSQSSIFKIPPLYWLLPALPAAIVLVVLRDFAHVGVPQLAIFIVACLAIVPLAGLMGRATENLAESMGQALGGLLNATFGNAAELIIALIALANAIGQPRDKQDALFDLTKASITGSIIGNVLLVLGLSILA